MMATDLSQFHVPFEVIRRYSPRHLERVDEGLVEGEVEAWVVARKRRGHRATDREAMGEHRLYIGGVSDGER